MLVSPGLRPKNTIISTLCHKVSDKIKYKKEESGENGKLSVSVKEREKSVPTN